MAPVDSASPTQLHEDIAVGASELLMCGRGAPTSAANLFDLECLLGPAKMTKLGSTGRLDLRLNLGSGSISLRRWLDHFERAVAGVPSALGRIEALLPGCAAGGEVTKHIENSAHWLRKMDEAVTLLRAIRDLRPAPGTEDQPPKHHDEHLLAEWASYNAVSVLIEAMPAMVEQVAVYHEILKGRVREDNEVAALRGKVAALQESLRSEQRHRGLFQERVRKLQEAERAQPSRSETDSSQADSDLSAPTVSEKHMREEALEWEAKFSKLEEESRERIAEQRRHSQLEAESLRDELDALKQMQRSTDSRIDGANDDRFDGNRFDGDTTTDTRSGRGGSSKQGRVRSRPVSRSGRDSSSALSMSRRPDSASCSSGLKTWEESQCGTMEHRRMAEDLKRRVFEQVLNEERERRLREESKDEEGLAALCTAQGSASLASLLRRVEDQHLRHEIFQAIQNQSRTPSALQIVCVYCRRKVRPEQIHNFDSVRPSSAASTISTRASGRLVPRSPSAPSIAVGLPCGMKIFGCLGDTAQPAQEPPSSTAGGSGGSARGSKPMAATAPAATGMRRAASAGRTRPVSGGWKPRRLVAVLPRAPMSAQGK